MTPELQPTDFGAAAFYEKHIYGAAGGPSWKTLRIGPSGHPSPTIAWFYAMGFDAPKHILELGCGAGRNFDEVKRLFGRSQLYGFDGSAKGLASARLAHPEAVLAIGNIHGQWPVEQLDRHQFDLVLDITTGIPESAERADLEAYAKSLYRALRPGGYAIIEAIAPDDGFAQRCTKNAQRPGEPVVVWEYKGDTKLERVMTLDDAIAFYRSQGFLVLSTRNVQFLGTAFGLRNLDRKFINLILQKPTAQSRVRGDFSPAEGYIAQGYTNTVKLCTDGQRLLVRKTLRQGADNANELLMHLTADELPAVGFLQAGGSVRLRTMPEQRELMERAFKSGLSAIAPEYADKRTLVMTHLSGRTLWDELRRGNSAAIPPALRALREAHERHILYGDRWAANIIIDKGNKATHIDFEIATEGSFAPELELAQLLYSIGGLTTCFDDSLACINTFVATHKADYNWPKVADFIRAYEIYFGSHPYGQTMERARYRLGPRTGKLLDIVLPFGTMGQQPESF